MTLRTGVVDIEGKRWELLVSRRKENFSFELEETFIGL